MWFMILTTTLRLKFYPQLLKKLCKTNNIKIFVSLKQCELGRRSVVHVIASVSNEAAERGHESKKALSPNLGVDRERRNLASPGGEFFFF